MTTKNKLIVGAVVLLAAALLAWQLKKRGGDSDSTTPEAGKAVASKTQGGGTAGSRTATQTKPGEINGTVVAKGAGPLAAVVQVTPVAEGGAAKPRVIQTAADGRFAVGDLTAGRYRVSASALGYLPALTATLELGSGDKESVSLELVKGGNEVGGTISDISGGPISMAFVRLTPVPGILDARPARAFSTVTDGEGRFKINAADGVYVLSAHHPDYVPRSRRVEVRGGTADLKLALVPGGVVEGVVLWAGSREPVGGATVRYQRETISRGMIGGMRQMRDGGQAIADSSGKFRITGAGAGSLSITAEALSASSPEPAVVPIGIAETVTGVEVLVADAFRISGTVVNKKGEPLERVNVVGNSGDEMSMTRSGAGGSFSLGPFPAGSYKVSASTGQMMGPDVGGIDVELKDKNVEGLEIVSEDALFIRGRVEPAKDAKVSVAFDKPGSMAFLGGAQTDESGAFEIGPVKAGATIPLRAVSSDGQLGEVEVKVTPAGADGVIIKLSDAASLAGRVVDQDGKPVASATVALRSSRGGSSRMVLINGAEVSARRGVSAPDGSFEVKGLEAGTYKVTVKNDRGQTMLWATKGSSARAAAEASEPIEMTIAEREAKAGVTLTVEADGEEIRGRVLGPDGKPAADVFVVASPSMSFQARRPPSGPPPPRPDEGDDDGPTEERNEMVMVMRTDDGGSGALGGGGGFSAEQPPVVTDEDGRFVITGLRRGDYDLVAEGLRGTARAFATKVKTGSDVTVKLQSLTVLEGVVTRDGKPVEDFSIELSGPSRFARSYKDKDGGFTVRRLDPGTYKLIASGGGGETEMPVEVVAGKPTKVEVVLQGQLTVKGRIVDAEGAPKVGALVVLSPRSGDGGVEIRIGDGAPPPRTDAEGRFVVRTLPGPFNLLALEPGVGPLVMKPVDITADIDLGDIVATGADTPPPPGP